MTANNAKKATSSLEPYVAELKARLPASWKVEHTPRWASASPDEPRRRMLDGAIDIAGPQGTYATLAVEAKPSFAPRDVERMLGGLSRVLREIASNVPLLVAAPWLSPRTQQILEAQDINFVDLTGNVLLKLDNPAVYVRSVGSSRNPEPVPSGQVRARGPKAGRLVRLLADVRPPYGVTEVAAAAGLNAGYVSRLLAELDRQALVDRSRRGGVEDVDVPRLLRWWAEAYDVFRANRSELFLAPAGTASALSGLAGGSAQAKTAVTGSFAAVRLAPVAAPALLLMYAEEPTRLADELGLLPADSGGNVALLLPFDSVVWERSVTDAGITYAAPSQVVVDCLTGTGRMPAEGEALLDWMAREDSHWRYASLRELRAAGEAR